MSSFIVPRRFCGPPESGNGGYTCGLVAQKLLAQEMLAQEMLASKPGNTSVGTSAGAVQCTLRAPIPLDMPLEFERTPAGGLLRYREKILVEAVPAALAVTPPPPVSAESATEAMASSPALDPRHPFSTCFVCGPRRGVNDGLRIFPAPVNGGLHVAAWIPAAEFGGAQQLLRPEFLWAAMDCPTGFAAGFPLAGMLVTGRLAVQQLKAVRTGESCVLMSWPLGTEGRKHSSAACLYQAEELCAVAQAVWIRIEE